MAITGTGTQADPFVVHSYSEFISLSKHSQVENEAVYIKWFDEPDQVLDCNTYGTSFKWGEFGTKGPTSEGSITFYIDLNGCTIKNFLIEDGKYMFKSEGTSGGYTCKIIVSNGSLRNVFLGSATSQFCNDYVEFHNVSISVNFSGSTAVLFNGNRNIMIDSCALYMECARLNNFIANRCVFSNTDIELHINDMQGHGLFNGGKATRTDFIDCRFQGKVGGKCHSTNGNNQILGAISGSGYEPMDSWLNISNCVIDMDFSEVEPYESGKTVYIIKTSDGGVSINTNVICKDHVSSAISIPSAWNYMTSSEIRNGSYLNNQGFTVVELVGG